MKINLTEEIIDLKVEPIAAMFLPFRIQMDIEKTGERILLFTGEVEIIYSSREHGEPCHYVHLPSV